MPQGRGEEDAEMKSIDTAHADGTVTMGGVRMSREAALCVEEVGGDPAADVLAIRHEIARSGTETAEANLRSHCLDGADEEREEGWRDYVSAIMLAAGEPA